MIDSIHGMVDFLGCLIDEEKTTGDQDQVLPGEGLAENFEDRVGQLDDPGDRAEQAEAHDQRQTDTDLTRLFTVLRRQLVG